MHYFVKVDEELVARAREFSEKRQLLKELVEKAQGIDYPSSDHPGLEETYDGIIEVARTIACHLEVGLEAQGLL